MSLKAVIRAPTVAEVLHEEEQATGGMGQVAEAGIWVEFFAAPPGEEVAKKGGEIATPFGAFTPVVSPVGVCAVGQNLSYLVESAEGE